jgi:hypothetical protein
MNDNDFKKPAGYKNITATEARPILQPILLPSEIENNKIENEKSVNLLTFLLSKLKFW